MNLAKLFSLYTILYLATGNYARIFFLPLLIIILIEQYLKNKIQINKKLFIVSIIFVIYNIIISLISGGSVKFILLHIVQMLIFIFFSGCTKELAIQYSRELKKTSFIIIGMIFLVILIKLLGFDISHFNFLTRYRELEYENFNRDFQLTGAISTIEHQIKNNISFGNPTHMNSLLFLIMLLPNSKISSLKYSLLLLPVSFFSGSRTFLITFSLNFINKLIDFKNHFLFKKKLFYSIVCISILITAFLFSKYSQDLIDNFATYFGFEIDKPFSSLISNESRRFSFYRETIQNINNFIFTGGGLGYNYRYLENLNNANVSSESLYLSLIIDYGLIGSLLIIFYFIKTFLKFQVISRFEMFLLLSSGLFIPYHEFDLIYILLGIGVNENINHLKGNNK